MRKLLIFIFLLCSYLFGFGQKFIQEYNASGSNLSQASLTRIENAIDSAIAPLSIDERSRFKVYDIGFYTYDTNKVELPYQMFNTWVDIIDGYPESDYYLIFGRVNSELNVPEEILVNVKLPYSVTECYSSEDKFAMDDIICAETNSVMSYDYTNNELLGINKLAEKIEYGLKCACYDSGKNQPPNPDSLLCKSKYKGFNFLDDKLRGLGFRRKQIEIGGEKTWTNGSKGIYDYFGKEVKINGIPYYIPDEITDSKDIFDAKTQVLPDTTIDIDLNGKVFILDDNSFVNNEWKNAFAESQNLDYCEYWVVLTSPDGKHYLYSRFTIGGGLTPVAMMRDENEIKDRAGVTLSPWGMALKALGNCAVDACVQAVIIRFTDESSNSWSTAFKKVDYLGAAWEGLSSILPWKTSPLVRKLGTALAKAITVVVDKAVKVSNYSVNQGLNDFVGAFGESIFSQILGEQIITKGELVLKGLTRFVKYNDNWLANKIAGKCFSGFLMKYGCFTESTLVYIYDNDQVKIKDIKLNSWVLSYKNKIENEVDNSIVSSHLTIPVNFEITNEYQIDFHSLVGTHECKLILKEEDLKNYEISKINDAVWLSIPEQGIEGTFVVDKIEHLKRTNTPTKENSDPDFVYSRVTGIFAHNSNDVWKLTFDNGEELKVTSAHPFLRDGSDEWVAVSALSAGDKVRTESGAATLISKVLLPGFHKVYNLSVENTKTFLVGDNGFVVHNTCAQLDDLANRFINNFSKELKKLEIDNWWKKGWPENGDFLESLFGRGMFFERLMRKVKFKTWNWTWDIASNFKAIDFYKKANGKNYAASLKTCNRANVSGLINDSKFRSHLKDLAEGAKAKKFEGKIEIPADEVQLYIAVPQTKLTMFENIESEIHGLNSSISGVNKIKVYVTTIENGVGL